MEQMVQIAQDNTVQTHFMGLPMAPDNTHDDEAMILQLYFINDFHNEVTFRVRSNLNTRRLEYQISQIHTW
jgi:hypothetical protein